MLGSNSYGSLNVPEGYNYSKVFTGLYKTCAITTEGELKCWGRNFYEELDFPIGYKWENISMNQSSTCGLTVNNDIKCWGANYIGQSNVPEGYKWKYLESGLNTVCGITQDGDLKCWGDNQYGHLNFPSGHKWNKVLISSFHACGLTIENEMKCWGGDNMWYDFSSIINVPIGYFWKDISIGPEYSCGITDDNELKCLILPNVINIPGIKSFHYNSYIKPQIPTPTNLKQYVKSPLLQKEEIQVGSKIGKFQSGSGVILSADFVNENNNEIKLLVEIYEYGKTNPKEMALSQSTNESNGTLEVTVPYLGAGDYTWKAKVIDNDGNESETVDYMTNKAWEIDFSLFEGFEPYPYGVSFVNSSPVSGLLTGGIKNVPNEKSYINFVKDDGYKWEIFNKLFPENLFYSEKQMFSVFKSYGLNQENPTIFYGGNCYGLSLVSTTYKKYPLKINEVSNEFYNKIGSGTIYDNISLLTDDNGKWNKYDEKLKTILFFQLAQKHSNYVTTENYYIKNKNPIDILNELKENPNRLYILGFGGAKNSSGKIGYHAVVPYRIEGNRIYIWDNNVPYPNYEYEGITYNAYDQYIEVYGNGKNDFKIKLYNDKAFGFNYFSDMSIVDLETIYGETENKAMGFNENDTLYTLSGNSEIILKDDLGRISGYKDGQIYEEIPGTIFVRDYGITFDNIDKENTWKQIYLPQKLENLTIEINGKFDENYDLMIAGGNYFTKLEGINTSSGQIDTFNISRENIKIDFDNNKILNNNYNLLSYDFQNNSTGSIYLHQLETIKEKQKLNIDWNKVINNENDSIKYRVDISNDGNYNLESYFNSMPKSENETGSISGYLKGINAPGNSNMAGWKIYIDSNNDNKLQENKERFVVTDNKGYFEFKDLEKGDYSIKIVMKPNWEQIKPNNNYYDISLNNGQNIVNLDFENKFLKGNNKK